MEAQLILDVRGIPEILASMRCEVAKIIRNVADGESDPRVARRLVEVAAAFECGQGVDGDG